MQKQICSICKTEFTGFGHNPEPIRKYEERCCGECNMTIVVPIRIFGLEHWRVVEMLSKYGITVKKERKKHVSKT